MEPNRFTPEGFVKPVLAEPFSIEWIDALHKHVVASGMKPLDSGNYGLIPGVGMVPDVIEYAKKHGFEIVTPNGKA